MDRAPWRPRMAVGVPVAATPERFGGRARTCDPVATPNPLDSPARRKLRSRRRKRGHAAMSSSSATDTLLRRTLPRPVVELWAATLDAGTDEARLKNALATFEWSIRLQILWALPVYLAGPRDDYIDKLLTAKELAKVSLGRWVELHRHLARALAGRDGHFLAGAFDWYVNVKGEFKVEAKAEIDGVVDLRNREEGHRKKGVLTANDARELTATAVPMVRACLRRAVVLHRFRMVVLRRVKRRTRAESQGEARFLAQDCDWQSITLASNPIDTDADDEPVVHLVNAAGDALLELCPLVVLRPDKHRTDAGSLPFLLHAIAKETLSLVQPTTGSAVEVHCTLEGSRVAWSHWLAQPPERFAELVVANPNPHALLILAGGALPVDGQVLCGHFELREIIGEGGMATVWRAWDSHLREECALKVLRNDYAASAEILERFQREAVLLRRVRHPNVLSDVQFEKDRDDGTLIIRMPLYSGRTLRQCITERPPAPQILCWAEQALSALVALHAAGIVHRDVKPANFLMNAAGDLVLGDFGVAMDENARMTRTVHQHGTMAYMAPEAMVSAKSATGKADVYSLGKVLHELLVGEELDHTVRPGEDLDGAIGELLKAMGQRLPEKRLGAAEALERVRGLSVAVVDGVGKRRSDHDAGNPLCAVELDDDETPPVGTLRALAATETGKSPKTNSKPPGGQTGAGSVPQSALQAGQLVGGRYVVEALAGRGGSGECFRARHYRSGQLVAIKCATFESAAAWDNRIVKFFELEANILGSLRNATTVRLLDFELLGDGRPYLVLEWIAGESLEVLLQRAKASGQSLSEPFLARMAAQVLRALSEAHDMGIVHRDVKPRHIMVVQRDGESCIARLLDFGIGSKAGCEDVQEPGRVLGTPAYMAPEACTGMQVDCRADVYAVGVTLFAAITHRLPFESDNPLTLMFEKATRDPADVRDFAKASLSPALARIVSRALARDPDDRFATAAEMATALEGLLPRSRRPANPLASD